MEPEILGQDFDKWLDWNGNAGLVDAVMLSTPLKSEDRAKSKQPYPVSPSSSAQSEPRRLKARPVGYTASNQHDLPTPEFSSGSPEVPHIVDSRLSGETMTDYPLIVTRPVLKRKLSPQDLPSLRTDHASTRLPPKKRPHNVIEKRYRANLNEKISELRDSIPSLRNIKRAQAGQGAENSDEEDLEGPNPNGKLNKASILTKAVEHIRHLELRNKRLDDENKSLKDRLQTLDTVLARGGDGEQRAAAFTSDQVIEQAATNIESPTAEEDSTKASEPPQGLIPLPESWRRFRENKSQEHYGQIYDVRSEKKSTTTKWPARLMLGSIAGLMILEGFGETDTGTTSKEKGLFGIPLELLDGWRFLRSPRIYLAAFAQFCRAGGVVPLVKGFVALTFLAFFIFAYLFNSKPSPVAEKVTKPTELESTSLSCTIEVRRRAWSTSMQALGLPPHYFLQEWMAVTAEWLRYIVNYLFGAQAYAWTTGRTGDDEIARIKAWDIAIDAQLAGGDPEVSRSRVVLTSFGSGTLPRTPLRMMLKSLQCRVLMWHVGDRQDSITSRLANGLGMHFANREWRRARNLQAMLSTSDHDRLPPYLDSILELDCDDVFTDAVVQRAYNMMYDRPTSENCEESLMDVVVEDHGVRSPLDAIAAWWSTQELQSSLRSCLVSSTEGQTRKHVLAALATAPPGSAAQTRALSVHAVFYRANRSEYLARAASALPDPLKSSQPGSSGPYFIDSSTPASARAEISNLLQCVRVLVSTKEYDILATHSFLDWNNLSLLTFAGLFVTLQELLSPAKFQHHPDILRLKRFLRDWLHHERSIMPTLPPHVVAMAQVLSDEEVEGVFKRRMSCMSNDTGYESQDDVLVADADSMDEVQLSPVLRQGVCLV